MARQTSVAGEGDGDRRRVLVQIAYQHIAERGLEGLRVRAVAADAGMNHATLLYYFPTKEALIQAVVEYLLHEFQVSRVPRPEAPTSPDEVRLEFEDMRYRLREEPELIAVLIELSARARRDAVIARLLSRLDDAWRRHLAALVRRGIDTGAFRSDLDPDLTATVLMAQIKGLGLQTLGQAESGHIDALVTALVSQVEQGLCP